MMAVTSLGATSGATEVGTDGASRPALRSSSAIAAVATHIAIDAISSSWPGRTDGASRSWNAIAAIATIGYLGGLRSCNIKPRPLLRRKLRCTFCVCHEHVGGNGTSHVAFAECVDFVPDFTDACVDRFRDGLSMHLLQIRALAIQHCIERFELCLRSA